MRYAIKLADGTYLRRQANPTWRSETRRRLVDTLEEATLWHKVGHAKNALLAAVENKHLPRNVVATIVGVKLVETKTETGPFTVHRHNYSDKLVEV